MDIPVESWYTAIFHRYSNRQYNGKPVEEELLDRLEKVSEEFRPFSGVRLQVVRAPELDVFKGLIGSFGKVREAVHYIAFIKNPSIISDSIIGYIGEGIILEATALGLNTCWVTGFFKPERVAREINLESNEQLVGVTPIGYAQHGKTQRSGVLSKVLRSHNRKSLETLILNNEPDHSLWMTTALEAARYAPSAINRQPWRFIIDANSITVSIDNPRMSQRFSKALDCGIAMLHLELGARKEGVTGSWEFLESPLIARYVF